MEKESVTFCGRGVRQLDPDWTLRCGDLIGTRRHVICSECRAELTYEPKPLPPKPAEPSGSADRKPDMVTVEEDESVRPGCKVFRLVRSSERKARRDQRTSARPRYLATVYSAEDARLIARLMNADQVPDVDSDVLLRDQVAVLEARLADAELEIATRARNDVFVGERFAEITRDLAAARKALDEITKRAETAERQCEQATERERARCYHHASDYDIDQTSRLYRIRSGAPAPTTGGDK